EAAESAANNNTRGAAQNIGNILTTDRSTVSLAGDLSAGDDIDWYEFEVNYDSPAIINGVPTFVFDLDYADGLARANTFLSIYDSTGQLVYTSRDSNVGDDRPAPLSGGGNLDDLSRGSPGGNDPFVGSVQLPVGTYYVAVTSN